MAVTYPEPIFSQPTSDHFGGLHHGVASLDHGHQPACLDQS
jgi:hypothetical protein